MKSVDAAGSRTQALWKRAVSKIPGGVNSPVRAFRAVGMSPVMMERAQGARVWDTDGKEYIDYVMGWGPLILGHAHPAVQAALARAARAGTTPGMTTPEEIELAEKVTSYFPSIEKLRLVNSGTEASLTALRLARAVTGREEIVKFDGCYHGHVDQLLVKAGSGGATLGEPDSAGVPHETAASTSSLSYNDTAAFRAFMRERGGEVAAVIVEPVAGNMGVVPGEAGFLKALRDETAAYGSLLIFDEIITGFRFHLGGVQTLLGIAPDLTLLGKILGGGLPIGAVGGAARIMDELSPLGPVYQAGTCSGNRASVAAGLAVLEVLAEEGIYGQLEERAGELEEGLEGAARGAGAVIRVNRFRSMLTVFFTGQEVKDFSGSLRTNADHFARFFRAMLQAGVFLPPSRFESWFVSSVHTSADIERTLSGAREAFAKL